HERLAELRAGRVAVLEAPPASAPAQASPAACAAEADLVCWNIARIGAGRTWADFGVRGEGITVANIDSGVRFDHPALIAQYRGSGPDGVHHDYNWYDAYGNQPAPVDSGNHGTHTMGTMVARGLSAAQPAVGVAPGSRWIAVRACSARECSELNLILAAQWMLAPTNLAGENPRPDLRPHVINNSWTAGQNATWYSGYVSAWRAAGIYPVFAAGNAGSLTSCGTIQSPGDYAQVTAVGATDNADRLASFSSIGPTLDGRLKPDLVAPGQSIYSTLADQRLYGTNSGTSMATPHIAGAVALLWSANPALIGNYAATYATLTDTAMAVTGDSRYMDAAHAACKPTTAPNSIYGYGRLDVYAALARATVDVPWLNLPGDQPATIAPGSSAGLSLTVDARMVPGPGVYQAHVLIHGPDLSLPPAVVLVTMHVPPDPSHAVVSGQVTRAADGAPLEATVRVAGGASLQADSQGRYSLTLPPSAEPYSLSASARDHQSATAAVTLTAGARATLDFRLEADQPHLVIDTTPRSIDLDYGEQTTLLLPIGNLGSQPLTYTLSLPAERYGVWRSDEADGPAATWTDPPPEATTVVLADDGTTGPLPIGFSFPFYQSSYSQITISANGVIALLPLPAGDISFAKTCLPLPESPGPAIAPLRVDLDPSQPGARVSYASLPEGLLVSWEQVPLFSDASQRLSFQALLMPDGRISLRYRAVGAIPPGEMPSFGLQHTAADVQAMGCKANLPLADGLTIELRPQVPGSIWMRLNSLGGSIGPSATASVPVAVRWVSPRPFTDPRSGVIELRSNDPTGPVARITVRLRTAAAPHTTLITQLYAR
ncbi:MAG: S8 family serine peptidase, partial [Chloroflexales bacterium]|nr:S8 family serine peptidase [Chloroflexales bacterium]